MDRYWQDNSGARNNTRIRSWPTDFISYSYFLQTSDVPCSSLKIQFLLGNNPSAKRLEGLSGPNSLLFSG
jgi:hypothetical protein